MSQTTQEAAQRALDSFAGQGGGQMPATVPATAYAPPAAIETMRGALAVAVRRDEAAMIKSIRILAAQAGEKWFYRWPVKNRKTGTTTWVEDGSIKMANALLRLYKNCFVDIPRIIDHGNAWEIRARFVDLENGTGSERVFFQRKSGGTMGDDAARQQDMALQMGVSKAIRNVVLNYLETPFADIALAEAKGAVVDKIGADLEKWRRLTLERLQGHVGVDRVEAVIGRPARDWLAPDIARVIAMMTSVVDGMATLDETFPPLRASRSSDLDNFASAAAPSTAAAEAGAVPSPPPPAGTAPVLDTRQRETIIDQLIKAATTGADEQDRLGDLDVVLLMIQDSVAGLAVPQGFIKELTDVGATIARGKMTTEDARLYLRGLT